MRITYRAHGGNRAYWEARWGRVEADTGEINLEKYPGRFAESVLRRIEGPILEAGCGAGRVLLHYRSQGRPIVGLDFIPGVLGKIREVDARVGLVAGDVTHLPFGDTSFAAVLAFGLYHNLEMGVDQALVETRRVLRPGGLLCASLRVDNLQNRLIDALAAREEAPGERRFHKANYRISEFRDLLVQAGFEVEAIEPFANMPFLYKFSMLRHPSHFRFDEQRARAEGYRFNPLGACLQWAAMRFFAGSFCNIAVATARVV